MLLEAATFTAPEMLARGFLSRVVPDELAAIEALGSAQRIAALAPQAARLNKQTFRALKTPPSLTGQALAAIENIVNGPADPYAYASSAEHREGITAFLEKRTPQF
jgi:enoyl-CoA hydratase/carnithine racemase